MQPKDVDVEVDDFLAEDFEENLSQIPLRNLEERKKFSDEQYAIAEQRMAAYIAAEAPKNHRGPAVTKGTNSTKSIPAESGHKPARPNNQSGPAAAKQPGNINSNSKPPNYGSHQNASTTAPYPIPTTTTRIPPQTPHPTPLPKPSTASFSAGGGWGTPSQQFAKAIVNRWDLSTLSSNLITKPVQPVRIPGINIPSPFAENLTPDTIVTLYEFLTGTGPRSSVPRGGAQGGGSGNAYLDPGWETVPSLRVGTGPVPGGNGKNIWKAWKRAWDLWNNYYIEGRVNSAWVGRRLLQKQDEQAKNRTTAFSLGRPSSPVQKRAAAGDLILNYPKPADGASVVAGSELQKEIQNTQPATQPGTSEHDQNIFAALSRQGGYDGNTNEKENLEHFARGHGCHYHPQVGAQETINDEAINGGEDTEMGGVDEIQPHKTATVRDDDYLLDIDDEHEQSGGFRAWKDMDDWFIPDHVPDDYDKFDDIANSVWMPLRVGETTPQIVLDSNDYYDPRDCDEDGGKDCTGCPNQVLSYVVKYAYKEKDKPETKIKVRGWDGVPGKIFNVPTMPEGDQPELGVDSRTELVGNMFREYRDIKTAQALRQAFPLDIRRVKKIIDPSEEVPSPPIVKYMEGANGGPVPGPTLQLKLNPEIVNDPQSPWYIPSEQLALPQQCNRTDRCCMDHQDQAEFDQGLEPFREDRLDNNAFWNLELTRDDYYHYGYFITNLDGRTIIVNGQEVRRGQVAGPLPVFAVIECPGGNIVFWWGNQGRNYGMSSESDLYDSWEPKWEVIRRDYPEQFKYVARKTGDVWKEIIQEKLDKVATFDEKLSEDWETWREEARKDRESREHTAKMRKVLLEVAGATDRPNSSATGKAVHANAGNQANVHQQRPLRRKCSQTAQDAQEEALRATGIFSGLDNENEHIQNIVKDTSSQNSRSIAQPGPRQRISDTSSRAPTVLTSPRHDQFSPTRPHKPIGEPPAERKASLDADVASIDTIQTTQNILSQLPDPTERDTNTNDLEEENDGASAQLLHEHTEMMDSADQRRRRLLADMDADLGPQPSSKQIGRGPTMMMVQNRNKRLRPNGENKNETSSQNQGSADNNQQGPATKKQERGQKVGGRVANTSTIQQPPNQTTNSNITPTPPEILKGPGGPLLPDPAALYGIQGTPGLVGGPSGQNPRASIPQSTDADHNPTPITTFQNTKTSNKRKRSSQDDPQLLKAIWLSLGFELDDIAKLTAYGVTSTNANDIEATLRKHQAARKKSQQSQANVQKSLSTRPNSRPEPVIQSLASRGRRTLNIQPPKTAAVIAKEKRVNQMLKNEEIWRTESLSLTQIYMWDNFKETKTKEAGFENFRRFEVVHFGFFRTRGLSEEDIQVKYITNNPDMATTVEGWKEEARILRDTVKWDAIRDTMAKDMGYADYKDLANVEYGMYEEDIEWFQDRLKYATPQFHRIEKVPAGSLGMGLPPQDGWAAEI